MDKLTMDLRIRLALALRERDWFRVCAADRMARDVNGGADDYARRILERKGGDQA